MVGVCDVFPRRLPISIFPSKGRRSLESVSGSPAQRRGDRHFLGPRTSRLLGYLRMTMRRVSRWVAARSS